MCLDKCLYIGSKDLFYYHAYLGKLLSLKFYHIYISKIKLLVFVFVYPYSCQGRMQDFSGGRGSILKFLGFWIYMPLNGMSRAAKLRAFARGFGGMPPSPQENFKKWCNFVRFEGFHGKKSSQKIINKHEFFH